MAESRMTQSGREDGIAVTELAKMLVEARRQARPVDLNAALAGLDEGSAYAVQRAWLTQAHGDAPVVGYKIGWADPEARRANGVPAPVFGRYTAGDLVSEERPLDLAELIKPGVEGEFCFIVVRPLAGAVTTREVLESCRVGVGMDLMDSRLVGGAENWLALVADNCNVGRAVVGGPGVAVADRLRDGDPTGSILADIEVALWRDGMEVAKGTGRRVALGDPATLVAWLAARLAAEGESLRPGQFILTGAAAGPVPMAGGGVWEARVADVGKAVARVAGGYGEGRAE